MTRHFPYLSAGITTVLVGAITSVVWAAQVPVVHPPVPHPTHPGLVGGGPSVGTPAVANMANTPGTGPAALPPGFQQAAAFANTGMNQPGQPSFGEFFYSMQTYMNQPGQPDYYDRLGTNPTLLQATQGTTTPPGPTTATGAATGTGTTNVSTTLPNSIGLQSTPTNTGSTVGFYNGFGPGSPNFGFFSGFTTPR